MKKIFFDIETTGLNPFLNKILTIQLKKGPEIVLLKIWDMSDESKMIIKFLNILQNIRSNIPVYGYNCLKFDVPFIWTRLNINGFPSKEGYDILYNRKWVDLFQCLGGNYVPIDYWLKVHEIKRDCCYTGKHIPRLYREKKYKEIENHAIDDLIVCEKLVDTLFK